MINTIMAIKYDGGYGDDDDGDGENGEDYGDYEDDDDGGIVENDQHDEDEEPVWRRSKKEDLAVVVMVLHHAGGVPPLGDARPCVRGARARFLGATNRRFYTIDFSSRVMYYGHSEELGGLSPVDTVRLASSLCAITFSALIAVFESAFLRHSLRPPGKCRGPPRSTRSVACGS